MKKILLRTYTLLWFGNIEEEDVIIRTIQLRKFHIRQPVEVQLERTRYKVLDEGTMEVGLEIHLGSRWNKP